MKATMYKMQLMAFVGIHKIGSVFGNMRLQHLALENMVQLSTRLQVHRERQLNKYVFNRIAINNEHHF
jgi:hypothetical protein